jgi:phospholipid-binding lipoprotein MlaA
MLSSARPLFALVAALGLGLLVGCATPPPANDPEAVAEFRQNNDPIEPANRFFYAVNDAADTILIKPIAIGYHNLLPGFVQTTIGHVLDNLATPIVFANDVLQGKPHRATTSFMRFFVNSTFGLAGALDVATDFGFPAHDSDFGMTLAVWGFPGGPYLFLPGLGPSNPRDAVGFGVDAVGDPWGWIGQGQTVRDLRLTRAGLGAVDARAGVLDELDRIKAQALDPYATIRSLSRQYRAKKIDDARGDVVRPPLAPKKSP